MVAISVVFSFLFFILIDILVLKFQGRTHPAFEKPINEVLVPTPIYNYDLPDGISLSKGHTWIKKLPDNLLQIGIDNFIIQTFKNIEVNKIPEAGSELKKGDVIMEGVAANKSLKFFSPISGVINKINEGHNNNNVSNPYLKWQVIIKPKNENSEESDLINSYKANLWIKEEFKRLEEFVSKHSFNRELVGDTMYDGGKPIENADLIIIEKNIEDFENEFLKL